MPKQTTRIGVAIGFQRTDLDGEAGWMLTIHDPHLQETELIPVSEELKETLVRELTGGVHVAAEMPPELARKMAQERPR